LVSSKGRYIWSDKPFVFQFVSNQLQVSSFYEEINVVVAGKNLKEAFLAAAKSHFPSTGTIPDQLLFSSPQYNTWIELMYNQNQQDILNYVNKIKSNDYPAGVLMIDDNWQKYYGNFEFKPEKFDHPKLMVDSLHAMGFKVMLWICPLISPDSPEFRFMRKKEYLVNDKTTHHPAIISWWNGYSASIDLTNPEAFNYFKSILEDVQKKYGIDGFKLDAGDVGQYLGNVEFFDKEATAVDFSEKWAELGLSFKLNEYRACWKMGGQPLVQRLRDKNYNWNDLKLLIPNMIAAGLNGYAYSCPDMIGGGDFTSFLNVDPNNFDQELIVRSCQTSALMPMMQFSVAPWRILSEKNNQICKEMADLHAKFGNYILSLAKESSLSGEPILKNMEYEFPDQGYANCKDQFMLGSRYLVAPMITKGNKREVILPEGIWRDELGKKYTGGQVVSIEVPLNRLPYFEKEK